jgi:hypothetical protein
MMKRAEDFKNASGEKKKDFVLNSITSMFDLNREVDLNREEKLMLFYLVELIIQLDKNKIKIQNATKKCCW